MDHAYSQHLSRLSKLLLAGTGLAFAWVLLSFALGLSTAQAHADEDGGLLGTVTSTVENTTSTVTTVVEDTTAVIVQPAAPVVQQVVQTAPAPVAPVVEVVESTVAPVVESTVTPVVSTFTTTVTELTESGVVAPIVDSTVDVVGAVPVVGEVVSALGVDTAASAVGSSVDGVLQGATGAVTGPVVGSVVDTVDTVTGVVDTTTGAVITPIVPVLPPVSSLDDALVGTVATTQTDAAAGPLEMLARAAYLTGATAWLAVTSDVSTALFATDSAFVSGGIAGGMFALLRAVMQADSALVGPGGAGSGAWVLVALGLVVAYRAWMRRTGLENDVAPPAPVMSTDVSPD